EREKRALVLTSEGQRDALINQAEGQKQQIVKESEAKRQQQINEAEGQAAAILAIARATAEGLREVAAATTIPGGADAVRLRVAEQWLFGCGEHARTTNAMILPANGADVASMISVAMNTFAQREGRPPTS